MGLERDSKTGELTHVYADQGNRGVTLDPDRQGRAATRARAALDQAQYHDEQAAVQRAKVVSICRTWNLDLLSLEPLAPEDYPTPEPPVCGGPYHQCGGCPNHPS